jgi:DNA-binding LacI/PurR family transcriptional regulator
MKITWRNLMKKPTIKEVAKLAETGMGTVSRVINNSGYVSKSTRKKVLSAIEELGYSPDPTARSLVSGSTNMVSTVVPMIRTEFYDTMVESLDDYFLVESYDQVIFPLLSKHRLKRFSDNKAFLYRTDGVIMASMPVHKLFKGGVVPTDRPVVLIDMYSNKYDCLYINNVEIGEIAARTLCEHTNNFRVLTFIEPDSVFTSGVFAKRLKGFRKFLRKKSISLKYKNVYHSEIDLHSAFSKSMEMLKVIKDFPVGFFATCDLFGYGIILAAKSLGIEIGKELFVVGVDDQSWSEDIGLTTIRQPIEDISKKAAEIIIEKIRNPKESNKIKRIKFKPVLIKRNSA